MPAKDYNRYMKQYMLNRYHERRQRAIVLLGGACTVCGRTETLEIDHINPEAKAMSLSKMWSVSEARYIAELSRCQLLCHEHHVEKSRAEGSFVKGVRFGGACNFSKLSEADVVAIRADTVSSLRELSARFGITYRYVRDIKRGRTWKHLPL